MKKRSTFVLIYRKDSKTGEPLLHQKFLRSRARRPQKQKLRAMVEVGTFTASVKEQYGSRIAQAFKRDVGDVRTLSYSRAMKILNSLLPKPEICATPTDSRSIRHDML